MPRMLDLEPPARVVVALLDGVRDDQLGDPTPCEGISVGDLLDHFLGLCAAFRAAAAKVPVPAGAEGLPADWRAELPRRLETLVAAWREPAAWEGEAEAGGVRMPADVMGSVVVDELVLHGWDLAKATGQRFHADAESTKAVFAFTTLAARPEEAAQREGLFGPVVEVPVDAPLLERALGLSGRDPGWSPGR